MKSARQFSSIFNSPKRLHFPAMTVLYSPAYQEHGKVAFVAGKRVGNAVQRNRCKRLMREVYKAQSAHFPETMDYVFLAKAKLNSMNFAAVNSEILKGLSGSKLVYND